MCFDNLTVTGIVISIAVIALVLILYRSKTS
jgi:multisubunit Na+/H+ antiporter MnhC subunit